MTAWGDFDVAPPGTIDGLKARIAELEAALEAERSRMFDWCAERQKITRLNWERAARKALRGDMSELRNRIALIDDEPMDIVLSDAIRALKGGQP